MRTSAQHAAPLGTGHLHDALEGARDLTVLNAFCATHHCKPADVSVGGRLDMQLVFGLMRTRGYQVSEPQRSQHQPRKGFIALWVHVRTSGAEFALGYYVPEPASAGKPARKKSSSTSHAH